MPHETRRAAREAAAKSAQRETPADRPAQRRRRWRAVWITLALILIVVLAALAWLAFRALTVKNELGAAQQLVTSLDDGTPVGERLERIGGHAEAAAEATADPVWHVFEFVPFVGDNLRAVRLASESLDLLANDVAVPALAAMTDESEGSPLARMLPMLEEHSPAVTALADEVADVRRSGALIGQVRSGIDQVDAVMQAAAPALQVVPSLLGADGAKKYLLVFQNNAESLPLGGSAASQTLVSADKGNIAIAGQASSSSFDNGRAVDVAVDQSALDLYSSYLIDHVNTATSRPDFPTAAQILRAFWQRDIAPDQIDGVVSIDPIALGRILLATGPIQAGDVEITSENAVSILLSQVYTWWNPYASKEQALASDAFFAGVAQSMFTQISTGSFDLKDMAWAVNESIAQGDIMLWSDDPQVAEFIAGQRVAGVLPTDNSDQTTVGVFFRDTSASKIDYYMDSSVTLGEVCDAGQSTFTASATLHLNIDQAAADALPAYVKSFAWGATKFRTEVFVYGPPGTTFADASVEGAAVKPFNTDVTDLGRPVAAFETYLAPGATATVTATFAGVGSFGPLELRSTPMIRPTVTSIESACG